MKAKKSKVNTPALRSSWSKPRYYVSVVCLLWNFTRCLDIWYCKYNFLISHQQIIGSWTTWKMFIWRFQKFSLCSIFSFWLWSFLLGFCSGLEQSLTGVGKFLEVSLGEKIFISAISLYASLRFFHFLFYDQLFFVIIFFSSFITSMLFFGVLYILQFCMLTFLRLHSFLKVSNLFSY